MQIVISISNSFYDRLKDMDIDNDTCSFNESALVNIIQHGAPLPKGHARLIDADALNRKDVNCANVPMNFIDTAPTIIEADKTEGSDKE